MLHLDHRGPAFGEPALRTLGAEGAPLNGLDVALRVADDWHNASALPGFSAVLALDARSRPRWPRFEFGSDEQISANLETLHAATPADAIAVGSVTRDPLVRAAVQPRTPNAFGDLARRSGW